MKNLSIVLVNYLFYCVMIGCSTQPEKQNTLVNPLLRQPNEIIDFSKLTSGNIDTAYNITISTSDKLIDEIILTKELNFAGILKKIDDVYNTIYRVINPLELIFSTDTSAAIRETAQNRHADLASYYQNIIMNEQLFLKIQKYEQTAEAKSLEGERKRFLEEWIRKFKQGGLHLDKEKQSRVTELKSTITRLGTKFTQNIAEVNDYLEITVKDTAGLDPGFLETRKTEKGTYKIDMSKPSISEFMKFSGNNELKLELQKIYHNRAYPQNLAVLDSILYYRQELAILLGYNNYTEYALNERMAKSPDIVWNFINQLTKDLQDKSREDIEQLIKIKSITTGKHVTNIEDWEKEFYSNLLMKNDYSIDEKEIKKYFEINNVLNGLFEIMQKIFALKFEEVSAPSVWHPEVRMFNCYDVGKNKLIGRFYLDLYPRENKYSHFAMFPITDGKLLDNGEYQIPEGALVCNFPKPEGGNPSLMTIYDVSTIFHEFGHLIHALVANAELSYLAGINNVKLDFVEAPSQIFENWAYHKESLALFAKHYQTKELLPDNLLEKLKEVRYVNSGIDALRQMFFATYDLTIHNKLTSHLPDGKEKAGDSTTIISNHLKKQITKFDFPENTHFQVSFGHLFGYGSGYYGYMWSKVYAQDMWSLFEEKGPLNPEIGMQYRKKILEPGASKDPLEMVKDFLGREPSNKALLKDLGVKITR